MGNEPETTEQSATLRVLDDASKSPFPIADALVIGRDSDSDIVLGDAAVSRKHARVYRRASDFIIDDLGSANGTFVERAGDLSTVKRGFVLNSGDIVRVGPFRLAFEGGSEARRDVEGGQPWSSDIHVPTVAAGFACFFGGFFIWALPAVLAKDIGDDFGLSASTVKLLPATSVLLGAVARFIFGLVTDARGPFLSGTVSLGFGLIPLVALAVLGDQQAVVWPAVALLGVGLAALPVAMPMASKRTAPQRRGLAVGIVSAGSIGIVAAALAAPPLAEAVEWRGVFALALIPTAVCLLVFAWGSRGAWTPAPRGEWLRLARSPQMRTVMVLFGITFGTFAGLYSFLPAMLRDPKLDYDLGAFEAALVVGMGALAGGIGRPTGGSLADRYGPLNVVPYVMTAAGLMLVIVGSLPVGVALIIFVAAMAFFDTGTGAVFKLAGQRFGAAVGAGAGLIGAAGGLLAFVIANVLTFVLQSTGRPEVAFAILATAPAAAATWLFISTRLQPEEAKALALPALPHLQRIDLYGEALQAMEVGAGLTIGRAPGNRLALAYDDLVSRNHAAIRPANGAFELEDLRSTNGTMLWRDSRWQPVSRERLQDADVIVIGSGVFRFSTGAKTGKG